MRKEHRIYIKVIVRPVGLQDEVEFFFYQCLVIFLLFHFQVGDGEFVFQAAIAFGIRNDAVLFMLLVCLIFYGFLSVENGAAMSFHLVSFHAGLNLHKTFVVGKSHYVHPFLFFFHFRGEDTRFVYRQFEWKYIESGHVHGAV